MPKAPGEAIEMPLSVRPPVAVRLDPWRKGGFGR